jgi:hypothetical protein
MSPPTYPNGLPKPTRFQSVSTPARPGAGRTDQSITAPQVASRFNWRIGIIAVGAGLLWLIGA